MHVDDGLPIGDAHLVEDGIAQETGVVDDRVDTTELLDGLFDDRCRTGRIGDAFAIGMRDSAGSPDLLDDVSGRTGITPAACGIAAAVVHLDHRPFSRPKQRVRTAYAAPGARSRDDLIPQTIHYSISRLSEFNTGNPALTIH